MTDVIGSIQDSAKRRGITRLCHFTPSRNFGHIAKDCGGILASRHLGEDEKAIFNPTDLQRLDGHPGHVCCSIQYPNAWYFRKARSNENLFPDWVVLLIKPHYLWCADAKFSPSNAATGHGRLISEGARAFEALFAETVQGKRTSNRGLHHPAFLPTDEQAEVLIPDRVRQEDIISVVVRDDTQAKEEVARLELLDLHPPRIKIVPEFFEDPRALSQQLRSGKIPSEREHQ